jgi:membrane-bound ClpP family serine protease
LESRKDLKARKEKIEINREKFLKIISSQTELNNETVKREKEIELIQRQEEKLSSEIISENSRSAKSKTRLEKKKLEISKIQILILKTPKKN